MSVPPRISSLLLAHATRNSLTPFLYQTRTLMAAAQQPLHSQQCCSYSTWKPDFSHSRAEDQTRTEHDELDRDHEHTDADPFLSEPARPQRKSYLHRRAGGVSPLRKAPKPHSMTQSEKQIFGEILQRLGAGKQDIPESALPAEPSQPTHHGKMSRPKNPNQKDMAQISAIFDSVLQDMRRRQNRPSGSATPGMEGASTTSKDDAMVQEKLRTLTFTDEDLTKLLDSDKISPARAIELVVQREAMRIETDLRAAIDRRDQPGAIWKFCQERIFSLVQHLKGRTAEEASILGQTKPPRTGETATPSPPCPLAVPVSVPIEAVVTALYPKMLLTAFRLLNLHFPDSQLIRQFRSTISSFGRESSVLGSSTALYNELIYFYWRGCHDMPGVVSLLHEMEVTGVEPDRQTCGMLNALVRQREEDLKLYWRQKRSHRTLPAREPWWDLPQNRKAVRELLGPHGWIHRLEQRIKDRKARERLYG